MIFTLIFQLKVENISSSILIYVALVLERLLACYRPSYTVCLG